MRVKRNYERGLLRCKEAEVWVEHCVHGRGRQLIIESIYIDT